jgi:hypothetical protein
MRRRAQRITVIAVETPPPLPQRPFAIEILRVLEANQAAERETTRTRRDDRDSSEHRPPGPQPPITD